MACADVDMDIETEQEPQRHGRREPPVVQWYQATEMLPDRKGPLDNLQQKQPAVLGSLQIVSGLLSVGVGILFAVTQEIGQSLFTLFRVSNVTGTIFIFAGFVSNLVIKYPALLTVALVANCVCIVVAVVGASLISVDLADWKKENSQYLQMEALELCVLGLEVFISAILCSWFSKERRAKSP